jgi:hypothetical protein
MGTLGDPHPNVRLFDITKQFCTFPIQLISYMKYLLTLLIFSILSACSSKKKSNIIDEAEFHLKEQLKDPSSYQVIKSEIIDTTMMSEHLKYQYAKDTLEVERIKIENELSLLRQGFEKGEEKEKAAFEQILKNKLAVYQSTADRHLNEMNNLKQDSIYCITVKFEYRAKNGFGALDKYIRDVKYFPANKTFKVNE